MIMIHWNFIIYGVILGGTLMFALTRDHTYFWFGSDMEWAIIIWIIFAVVFTPIWGGIFWW